MAPLGAMRLTTFVGLLAVSAVLSGAACSRSGFETDADTPFAPGLDLSKEAVDGVEVGNRLMDAGEYELALEAFTRAALDEGLSVDVLVGMGTANLGLGRLGQSEGLLRRATDMFPDNPEAWNNLGVVLIERGKIPEAQLILKRAYALDNGESDAIRDNLRLALAKEEKPANNPSQEQEYKLVRSGSSQYLIRQTP